MQPARAPLPSCSSLAQGEQLGLAQATEMLRSPQALGPALALDLVPVPLVGLLPPAPLTVHAHDLRAHVRMRNGSTMHALRHGIACT